MNPPGKDLIFWNIERPELLNLPSLQTGDPNTVRPIILQELKNALTLPDEFSSPLFKPLHEQNKCILQFLEAIPFVQLQRIYSHVQKELPNRNSQVVEFNTGLTTATNSNTCVSLFGSASQSCNAVNYALKYLIKDLRLLQASLTALNHGFNFIQRHPSVAVDAGTNKRIAQHWLAHIRNTALLQKEICDAQALATLVGPLDTLITSDSFVYFGPYDHIKQICNQY